MDEQQAFAEPAVLQWGDKTLKLSLITQNVKKAVNAACKANAIAEWDELKTAYASDLDKIAQEWQAIRDLMMASHYSWTGPACNLWLQTSGGQRTLIETLLKEGGTPLSSKDTLKLMRDKSMKDKLASTLEIILMESEAPN